MEDIKVSHCTPREIQERGEKVREELKGQNLFVRFETKQKILERHRRLTYQPRYPVYIPFDGE
jgi:hypothetical protein